MHTIPAGTVSACRGSFTKCLRGRTAPARQGAVLRLMPHLSLPNDLAADFSSGVVLGVEVDIAASIDHRGSLIWG